MMENKSHTLDLSTRPNNQLYAGCQMRSAPGKLSVEYSAESIDTVARNAEQLANKLMSEGVTKITLTGPTAIWVYLIVFHAMVHRFREIHYDNGQPDGRHLIALHS